MVTSTLPTLPDLPLSAYRDEFTRALSQGPLLLEAEPGAGKSTLAPLWVLAQAPADQEVWLVQPRILAARRLAGRLAQLLGEPLGQTVGLLPFDRCGEHSRLVLMTPGVLLQRLLRDPELPGVCTILLDEVHERSLDQDTAWTWLRELVLLREDLRLILMSATPDPALREQVSQRLSAPGRCHPVAISYCPARSCSPGSRAKAVREPAADHLLRALEGQSDWRRHTTLVFLPGWRAIEDCAEALCRAHAGVQVVRLHSRVPDREQDKALDPATGPRVILATNIAETSLTIADVTLVVDSGLVRRPAFEQSTGVSRLHSRRISRASAEQRAGRAGRMAPGHCIRLWSPDEALVAAEASELRAADYLPLALRLAHWGSPVAELPWLEAPNPLALEGAQRRLKDWQLLDSEGRITDCGRQVAQLGTHPRLAALLHSQVDQGARRLDEPLLLLALALHFDWSPQTDASWLSGATWLVEAERELARNRQWQQQRRRWLRVLRAEAQPARNLAPEQLLPVFNEHLGHRQDSGRYRLNSGISVEPLSPLEADWAVFPQVFGRHQSHVGQGWPLSLTAGQVRRLSQVELELEWRKGCWRQRATWRLGGAVTDQNSERLDNEALAKALVHQLRARGLFYYPWPKSAWQLLARARLARARCLLELPPLDEQTLLARLESWWQPFVRPGQGPEQMPWAEALAFYLGYETRRSLEALVPESLSLPSGRRVSVDYPGETGAGDLPEVCGKLQEFFGCRQLSLAQGRLSLRLHLLAPNGSALAITSDLTSFWEKAYPEVRKQMRGRYPKHPWPEQPLDAAPSRLTKKRLDAGLT